MSQRALVVSVLLVLLGATGCHKSSTENAATTNSGGKTSATQPQANATVADNLPPVDAAPPSARGNQASQDEVPAKLIIPAGTSITVRLQQRLSSASAVPGQRFEAVIDEPVVVGGRVVIPAGSVVKGHVTVARHSGRLRHPGQLGLTLDRVTVDDQIVMLDTSRVVARGGSHKKRNWGWIGGGTGGGALIGALAAGGKGALIGSGIGAAAGTTTAFITGKKNVTFGSEHRLRFRLNHDVSMFG